MSFRSSPILAGLSLFLVLFFRGGVRPEDQPFIRGDVNADGFISLSDVRMIGNWLFDGFAFPATCWDAADIDDNEDPCICDIQALNVLLYRNPGWTVMPVAPFPAPGLDPTRMPSQAEPACTNVYLDDPFWSIGCDAYTIEPPKATTDYIRIGDVAAIPGKTVQIPIYLTTSVPVEALQLLIQFDSSQLQIASGLDTFTFENSFYSQFVGKTLDLPGSQGQPSHKYTFGDGPYAEAIVVPEDGLLMGVIYGHSIWKGLEIQPGEDILVGWIQATVAPDVAPGTIISVAPTNGPEGEGIGPFHLHNELCNRGEAGFLSLWPLTIPGSVRANIIGDITFFFIRGDSNRDGAVDISDALFLLSHLFLGGKAPACLSAADADDSGRLDLSDAIFLLGHLFLGAGKIPPPFPDPGIDVTQDPLSSTCE